MKLLVTGITGLTGRYLYARIKKDLHVPVVYLVRKTSDRSFMDGHDAVIFGDLSDPLAFADQLKEVTAILHVAPRHRLKAVMDLCAAQNITRLFYVNSTGIYSRFKKSSHIDLRNETELKASSLVYTIIRPSMIYGNAQDGNLHHLAKIMNRWPLFPIIGPGQGLMQPIHADDLAQAILSAVQNESLTRYKAYDVAGIAPIAYKELLSALAKAMHKPIWFVHFPYNVALWLGKLADKVPNPLLSYEKVLRLHEDKVFDTQLAQNDLQFSPRSHELGLSQEVEALIQAKVIKRRHKASV
jgi:uncharacterized protein YbjT (DUF2867 family)